MAPLSSRQHLCPLRGQPLYANIKRWLLQERKNGAGIVICRDEKQDFPRAAHPDSRQQLQRCEPRAPGILAYLGPISSKEAHAEAKFLELIYRSFLSSSVTVNKREVAAAIASPTAYGINYASWQSLAAPPPPRAALLWAEPRLQAPGVP